MSKLGICNFSAVLLKCSQNIFQTAVKVVYSQLNLPLARSEKRLWSLWSNPPCVDVWWEEGGA